MKRGVIWGVAGCLVLCLSTCDQSSPTMPFNPVQRISSAPDAGGVTAESIVVTSSKGAYFVGETEPFAASLSSGGLTTPVTEGTWATDTPGVATVNDTGLVTIVGQGWANISCTFKGLTGSKQVWGMVDCRGAWSGTYSVRRCELWKDFPDPRFCETHGGSGLPIELVLTQEGELGQYGALRGTIKLGDRSTPFVAKPLLDGTLEMEGEVFSDPYWINVAMGCHWTPAGPEWGLMLYYYRGDRSAGQAMLWCDISLSKTGARP